ncbi:MAG TPA: acyl-CoA dehydrogenase family protein [Actinocrinis sp.]|nr:acyl-CoA dehydrogenase family protein [Actinocrinis sp.]
MPGFSLELTEEQRDLRAWVHTFAADAVRPAAAEWDDREETPWPVLKEAAEIGLYGFESLADMYGDPTGLSLQIADEERFWGDAGIGMALSGTSLTVAGIFAASTPLSHKHKCPWFDCLRRQSTQGHCISHS